MLAKVVSHTHPLPAQLGSRGVGKGGGVTVCIRVDSELATNTNTSASKQNLSIQLSSSVVTSMPGLEVTGVKHHQAHRPWALVFLLCTDLRQPGKGGESYRCERNRAWPLLEG